MPELPATAAWRHRDARTGFEVVFLDRERSGYRLHGYSTAVQEGEASALSYTITLDHRWLTRSAHVAAQSASGRHEVRIEGDGSGAWRVDGGAT